MVDTNTDHNNRANNHNPNEPLWPENIGQLMQFVPDAIIMINRQQQIVRFNNGAEEMFGYQHNEVQGQPVDMLLPQRFRHHHKHHVDDYMAGEEERSTKAMERGDLYALHKDGTEFPIEATLTTLSTPHGRLAVVIVREISERKAYEAAILERNAELDAFAHTVAHDLKGPLHHMLGFSTLLSDEVSAIPGETGEALHKYVSYIQRAAVKAGNIINELLLLASIRREDVKLTALDTKRIIQEALKRLEIEITMAEAVVHVAESWPPALGHPEWIEEIWINYISNGVKYSGSPPTLSLDAMVLDDGFVRFMVKDNGSGIPPEKEDLIFAPFTRLDRIRAEGHGLGLSIVRRIADKLGGRVGYINQDTGGACFYFDLPQVK
jgi:PAS domain S-box-containing protein